MRLIRLGFTLLALGSGSLAVAQTTVTNPTLPNVNVPGNSAVLPGSNISNTVNPNNLNTNGTPTYNTPGTMLNNTPTIPMTNLPSANGTTTGTPTLGQPSSTGIGTGFTTGNTPTTTGTLNTPGVGTAGTPFPSTIPSTTGNLPGQTGAPPSSVIVNPAPGATGTTTSPTVTNPGPSTQGGLPAYTP